MVTCLYNSSAWISISKLQRKLKKKRKQFIFDVQAKKVVAQHFVVCRNFWKDNEEDP